MSRLNGDIERRRYSRFHGLMSTRLNVTRVILKKGEREKKKKFQTVQETGARLILANSAAVNMN